MKKKNKKKKKKKKKNYTKWEMIKKIDKRNCMNVPRRKRPEHLKFSCCQKFEEWLKVVRAFLSTFSFQRFKELKELMKVR